MSLFGEDTAFPVSKRARIDAMAAEFVDRGVYIVGSARTPIGGLNGSLATIPATKLGSIAIEGALKRANVAPSAVQEVYMGHVLPGDCGQHSARQASLGAGIPNSVPCTQVNKVCASGMKAIMLGASSIRLGDADVIVAGGMESMTQTPHYLHLRVPVKYGDAKVVDGLARDGLSDTNNGGVAMGVEAELLAETEQFSRKDQDDYAVSSYSQSQAAQKAGHFAAEIVPVPVPQRKGPPKMVEEDEEFDEGRFRKLATPFKADGTVTAGNASSISDGAAAVVLASGAKCRELGLKPCARIWGYADGAHDPKFFTTAPSVAIPLALKHAGKTAEEMEYWEVNEAFSVVALANQKLLNLPADKVNVHGGAVSIGHPLGCSGARVVVALDTVLRVHKAKLGCAGICNGGGGASAIVIEHLE